MKDKPKNEAGKDSPDCSSSIVNNYDVADQRRVRQCVTHHFACDCREALMAESMETHRKVIEWRDLSDDGLRLRCGELTAQEIRTIRAVLNAILPANNPHLLPSEKD